jgi:colanic acid/amylovoran biosynthesis glycosyltransferase
VKNPRIAYLVSRYPAISHTFILREVAALRAQGFDISVASINDPDRATSALTEEERFEAANTLYVKSAGLATILKSHAAALVTGPLRYLRGLAYALRLARTDAITLVYHVFYFVEAVIIGRWMAQEHREHLHVHFATPAATVALIASKCFPITYSITVHGPDEFYDVAAYRLREKVESASFVLCIGMFARSQLMKITDFAEWCKLEICPLGVDPEVFTPAPFRERADPFSILCVGRLVSAKGQHILVLAAEALVRAGQRVRVEFVGDGPDRASLESLTAERGLRDVIHFAGSVNQDRIRGFYERADAFVLPSFAEGIPVVLMEAMAMEIPCVTSMITGIPELIRHGEDGLLVMPSDVTGLASAMQSLIASPELRRRLGRSGRERVRECYNLPVNTRRLGDVFQRRL